MVAIKSEAGSITRILIISLFFLVSTNFLYGQKPTGILLRASSEYYSGTLLYADSSTIFIKQEDIVLGFAAGSIDHITLASKIRVGRTIRNGAIIGGIGMGTFVLAAGGGLYFIPYTAVGAVAGGLLAGIFTFPFKYQYEVDIKGIPDRYFSLLPFMQKKSVYNFRLQEWDRTLDDKFIFSGDPSMLKPLRIPSYFFLEAGGGPMFTPADNQMVETIQQLGIEIESTSFGITFGPTDYAWNASSHGSYYFRFGYHLEPKLDAHLTYRKSGPQEVWGFIDTRFILESENISLVTNYLLSNPDYFLSRRWKVGIGGGPSINFLNSEVDLVQTLIYDSRTGILIGRNSEVVSNQETSLGFNIDVKTDFYLRRNFYFTTSLEYQYVPKIKVSSKETDLYTFNGASINPSALHWSFGLGINLW